MEMGHIYLGQLWGCLLLSITRSPAQKPACKDLGRNGKDRLFGNLFYIKAVVGLSFAFYNALAVAEIYV
ncbi:hypothetical protein AAW28_07355 [Lacticaseibacillus casei]|nr:hypothetical protein AAW28_07355 [Lacticaseibacillus casei]